ncbi:MAG: cysteine desulfurase NifS [Candidatus Methanocorpusculum faecipullorum]|nr:cysteine desulfurase NifS [Candidatus Methanocorpusculum faecipullorum]HJK41560.1 cysteine desulfurase NifS [Methanocorpusculum sp.]
MDHAATTYAAPEVVEAMLPYFSEKFGNPSSVYGIGQENKAAVDEARAKVAAAINAEPNEIYFTAGGTESDNWALKGVAFANIRKGKHIITTAVEHHAILHAAEWLQSQGFEVTYLPVDQYGMVSPADVEKAIRPDTILISVMYANNEVGTIQPIAEIGAIARAHGIYFHTDAVQAVGHVPIDVKAEHIDMLSLSGHKFYGPKGIGVLYIRRGVRIQNLLHGGAQESRHRAGTENVAGIVGLGAAIERAVAAMPEESARLTTMRDHMIRELLKIPASHLNGHPTQRLPNNVNITFEYIEGEGILLLLNMFGICASTGSACNSASLEPSHVLTAMGVPHEIAHGSVRLTLGERNTEEDVSYVLEKLPEVVGKLRSMSPLTPEELR